MISVGRVDTDSGAQGRRLRGQRNAGGICNDEGTNFDRAKTHRGVGCITYEFESDRSKTDLLPVLRIERVHRFSHSFQRPYCRLEPQCSERQFIR